MVKTSLKSMTGYGRASASLPQGTLLFELSSVNRRHLEINLNLPRNFLRFEFEIKKWVQEAVHRGQINGFLKWQRVGTSNLTIKPNLPLAREIVEAWKKIAGEVEIEPAISLHLLSKHDVLQSEEDEIAPESLTDTLYGLVKEALIALEESKSLEGEKLAKDFLTRIHLLKSLINNIESEATGSPIKQREKLTTLLAELFPGSHDNQEKIEREIALLAEKLDISEEVLRFKAHLEALENWIQQISNSSKGKKMEFILQELHREVNTIGSKSNSYQVSRLVIEAKSELEKMREQVQNVE